MPHPGHARRTVRKDPSAKRLGTYQSKPAKKKSLGIKGAAGIISSKALKGIKWSVSPQADKLMTNVVSPGRKLKIGAAIARTVAPKAVKKAFLKLGEKFEARGRNLITKRASSLKSQIKGGAYKRALRDMMPKPAPVRRLKTPSYVPKSKTGGKIFDKKTGLWKELY